MPLIQPTDSINLGLVQDMRIAVAAAAAIVRSLNQMGERLTRLPDDALSDWLNSKPTNEIDSLLQAHFDTCHMVNACIDRMLAAAGDTEVNVEAPRADVRPLPERLHAAGREAILGKDGRWVVRAVSQEIENPAENQPTPPVEPPDEPGWPPPSFTEN